MAIIDQQGNVLDYGAYYLTNSEKLRKEAQKVLADKIRKFKVTLLSIGNGTASYETEQLARRNQALPAPKIIVNPEVKDFYDFTPEDITLDGYEHLGKLSMTVAV